MRPLLIFARGFGLKVGDELGCGSGGLEGQQKTSFSHFVAPDRGTICNPSKERIFDDDLILIVLTFADVFDGHQPNENSVSERQTGVGGQSISIFGTIDCPPKSRVLPADN